LIALGTKATTEASAPDAAADVDADADAVAEAEAVDELLLLPHPATAAAQSSAIGTTNRLVRIRMQLPLLEITQKHHTRPETSS
jgi:hypothetical protein